MLGFPLPETQEEARQNWKALEASADLTIVVAASYTADSITPYLGSSLHLLTEKTPEIIIGPYDQIEQICAAPENVLGVTPDILLLLWRLEDMGSERILNALNLLAQHFKGVIIVSTPPRPYKPEDIITGLLNTQAYTQNLNSFMAQVAKMENILTLDIAALIGNFGADNAHDTRKWALYKQPYSERFWHVIGHHAARLIAARTVPSKKCIVLDGDNTLWGGIIGEDGIGGIDLGDEFPGNAYRDFQKQLKTYAQTGIFLALASKNNPDDVDEVFERHDAMVLTKDDISVLEVHWESKAESLKRIADKLNIGLDSLVFIDDNPKELGEVQERLPEVTCLLVPEDIEELPWLLSRTTYFDRLSLSEEDALRVKSAKAETERKSLKENMSEEDFLKSLELEIEVFKAEEQHLGRVIQLLNKTNQFNLTTRRKTAEEVKEIFASKNHLLLGMKIADKYGEYGLVGVCILEIKDQTAEVETLLMSCRVLGRKAETAFLSAITRGAIKAGAKTLSGTYIRTAKNKLVENLYKEHGFVKHGENWLFDLEQNLTCPDFITVKLDLV